MLKTIDQTELEVKIKKLYGLPYKTVWIVLRLHAKRDAHVTYGYHDDKQINKWINDGCIGNVPEKIGMFTFGDRLVDWWDVNGKHIYNRPHK